MHHSSQIKQKFELLNTIFNERQRRLWAAAEARALGRGGISRVADETGLSPKTIRAGLRELDQLEAGETDVLDPGKVRQPGGGRRLCTQQDPALVSDLEALFEPRERGPVPPPLCWTCKSTGELAAELQGKGHTISPRKVGQLLHDLGYRLRARRKGRVGGTSPDRDTQFAYLLTQVEAFHRRKEPVVALETRKQELIAAAVPSGGEEEPEARRAAVGPPHFLNLELARAFPSDASGPPSSSGWVSVGIDENTVEFAVETLPRWWRQVGCRVMPRATELLIIADAGDILGSLDRFWTVALQRWADESRLRLRINHFPPGTSRWSTVTHRMLCHTTTTWPGTPPVSHGVFVNLIGELAATAAPPVEVPVQPAAHPPQVHVSEEERKAVRIERAVLHGDWNFTITPHP
jgi:hypothetical protein